MNSRVADNLLSSALSTTAPINEPFYVTQHDAQCAIVRTRAKYESVVRS